MFLFFCSCCIANDICDQCEYSPLLIEASEDAVMTQEFYGGALNQLRYGVHVCGLSAVYVDVDLWEVFPKAGVAHQRFFLQINTVAE